MSRMYKGTNPERNRTTHAEIAVYIMARRARIPKKDLVDAIIYVAKADVHANGYRDSKPCKLCMKFLKRVGITRVYYSVPNGIERL